MTMTSLEKLNARLQEAFDNLWDDYVDPREAFAGEEGTPWRALGASGLSAGPMALEQLAEIRLQCRHLLLDWEERRLLPLRSEHVWRLQYALLWLCFYTGVGGLYKSERKGVFWFMAAIILT